MKSLYGNDVKKKQTHPRWSTWGVASWKHQNLDSRCSSRGLDFRNVQGDKVELNWLLLRPCLSPVMFEELKLIQFDVVVLVIGKRLKGNRWWIAGDGRLYIHTLLILHVLNPKGCGWCSSGCKVGHGCLQLWGTGQWDGVRWHLATICLAPSWCFFCRQCALSLGRRILPRLEFCVQHKDMQLSSSRQDIPIVFRALGRCPYATNMQVQSISLSRDRMPTWFHGLLCSDMQFTSISADISFGSLNVTFLVQHLPSCIYLINEDGSFFVNTDRKICQSSHLGRDLLTWKLHPLRQQFLIQGHWRSLALPKRLCWDGQTSRIHPLSTILSKLNGTQQLVPAIESMWDFTQDCPPATEDSEKLEKCHISLHKSYRFMFCIFLPVFKLKVPQVLRRYSRIASHLHTRIAVV